MKRMMCLALVIFALSACSFIRRPKSALSEQTKYQSYKEIPDVTQEEIDALEELLAKSPRLVYGACASTEAFLREDGSVGGFAALFGNRLSELFGFEFDYYFCSWEEMNEKIVSKEIDIVSDFTATPERLEKFLMTDAIIQRTVKVFTDINADSLKVTSQTRAVRCAFMNGSTTYSHVAESWSIPFEPVFISDQSEVPGMLLSGEIDAFIEEGTLEAAFDAYDFIRAEEYYPLTYSPISMTTGNPKMAPVISVMQKYLKNGGYYELAGLYNQGYKDYLRHKLSNQLTEEEKAYIQMHRDAETAILAACEADNYPTSFYNSKEKKFQGMALDTLDRISELTGLVFEVGNEPNALWPDLIEGLESGKYSVISELLRSSQREGRYIWADRPYCTNNYALLSNAEYPDVDINQILFSRVGLMEGSAHTDVFLEWFPESANTKMYKSVGDAFAALVSGEIDLLMASENMLLNLTNYQEKPGFKANIIFKYSSDSFFGFNKDEEILRSIVNKALRYANTEEITSRWQRKVFDYQSKMFRDTIPLIILFAVLLLTALFVVLLLLAKNHKFGKNLEKLVAERTNELARQTMKLEVVVKNYSGVIWSVDKDRRITLFDGLYIDKIGVTPSFLEGKPLSLARQKNRHLDILEMVEKTFEEGPQDCISEIDGEIFKSHTTPIKDDRDNIIGVVGDTVNVTETIRLQKELQATIKIAESASKAKGDFLSRMSHEIRTPLNAIIGMNSIALNTDDLEKIRNCHEKINTASKHLLGVINDILDMSKIEADKFELTCSEFDFEKALMNITNVINFRADEKRQNLVVNLSEGVPAFLFGDELRLSQVITNLLSNAVKFTPENGTVVLNVEKTNDTDDEVTLRIEVADNGIGISEEQQKRLFTSFEQADGSISRKFGGTGLGLAISKRIVELMGGTIWIESEPGKGSKFTFTVKIRKGKEKTYTSLSPKINKENLRILAVDDSEETRICFLRVMEAHGLPCDAAAGGSEALDKIKNCGDKPYNVFFIDWQMPGMDGIELTKKIKEITGDNAVVFMISVADWNNIQNEALSAGVRRFVPKPLFPSALIDAVNECLGDGKAKPAARARGVIKNHNFRGHTVLIAEDVEINQEIIAAVLEKTGVAIDFADNGQTAVSMFEEHPGKYSLILMDIHMPEMDGYEATRAIRALGPGKAKNIPIIAMTANVFREDIENCLAAGMNDHIGKPIESESLLAKLDQYMTRENAAGDSAEKSTT